MDPRSQNETTEDSLDFEYTPEKPSSNPQSISEDPSRDLDDFRFKRLQSEVEDLKQQLLERKELHDLRKWHSRWLFALTVFWVFILWGIVLVQGIGVLPWKPEGASEYLKFSLEDSVIIAFMTSTTATVLGLYGIAAYWLFGKPKPKDEEKPSEKKDDDSKSK